LHLAGNGIIAGAVYALIALGFVLIHSTVRFFHIAHGAIYVVGAYVAYIVIRHFGGHLALGLLCAAIASGILGVLIDRAVYRPLRLRKAGSLVLLIASFGVLVLVQNVVHLVAGSEIRSLRSGPIAEGHHILGAVITDVQLTILAVGVILMALTWLFIRRTRHGKSMRAVADDRLGASVVGIDPERVIGVSFLLGSCLAGIAGALIALETSLTPTMGFNAIIKGIIAAIVGGIGSLPGALLGGLFLGIVENVGIWKIDAGWKDCIAFGVLIAFLVFRPRGIMGHRYERKSV